MTLSEKRLASIIASQISQTGLADEFKKAFLSGNTDDTRKIIEIGSDTWKMKIDKIQSLCNTRVECKNALTAKVLKII